MRNNIINLASKESEHGFMPTLKEYILDYHDGDSLRPAVIIFPGGGYAYCSHREAERVALFYNAAGFNAFVLDYSPAPHRYPTQINEAAASVEFVRTHAKDYNIAPDKIAIIGFSAGGHLAASLSTLWNNEKVFSKEKIASALHKPNACILSYPVITSGEKAHRGSFENLLGKDVTKELVEFLSLENRVTETVPPTFIWHTYTDMSVPVENSLFYATALSKCKVPLELHIYPNGPHGMSRATDETIWSVPALSRKYDWPGLSVEWLIDLFELNTK